MQSQIHIYREQDGNLACTFNDVAPTEPVLRTVSVHPSMIENINSMTVSEVRAILNVLRLLKRPNL